jgi:general secretion pathway protein G
MDRETEREEPMKTTRRTGRAPRAFTLIELMLVMVILATLAALVVPRFSGQSEKAKVKAAAVDISSIETALDAFEVSCGRYPTTEEGLRALIEAPASAKDWDGPYLRRNSVPVDPWGAPYNYRSPGQHNTNGVDLYSFGPNGQEGGGDDIDNWSR